MRTRSGADGLAGRRTTARGGARPWAAAAVALLAAGCWYPKERGQRVEERLDRIEGEGAVRPGGGADRAAAEEQVRRLDARVAEVQAKLNELGASAQQGGTERSAKVDKLTEEVTRLRAALDAQAHRLEQLERAGAERRQASVAPPPPPAAPERRASVAAPAPRRREPAHERAAPAPPERPATERAPADRTAVLALAREHEAKGNKAVAREIYSEYVDKFPGDPSTARARFRLGELAFGDRQYQEAIHQYGLVAKEFPRSDEAPEALLRTADSMLQLKLRDDAAAVLSEIPKRYPGTPAAERARARLAEIGGGGRK